MAFGELRMDVKGSKEFGVSGLGEQFQPPTLFPWTSLGSRYPLARLSSRVSSSRKAPAQFQALRAAQAPAYLWCSLSGRWVFGDGGRAGAAEDKYPSEGRGGSW